MKRILSCCLIFVWAFAFCLPAYAEEWTTQWDLTDLFESDAAAEAAIAEAQALIGELSGFRGTLDTVEGVVAMNAFMDELRAMTARIIFYAQMQVSLDAGNGDAKALYGRAVNLDYDSAQAAAFINEELFGQSDEFLDALAQDERMQPYLLEFTRTRRERDHLLSEEQENLLLPLSRLTEGAADLYGVLSYLEMPWQDIEFPDGVVRQANASNYPLALQGGFSQEFRKAYAQTMLGSYADYRNTYAQNFANYLTGVSENAKAHGYASALEASLTQNDVELALYEAVIDSALASGELIDRYADLMKQELGLDEIYSFDLNRPIAPDPGITYTYGEACELVLAALAPLGEDYVRDARHALSSGWVDVYPSEGKESGAFSGAIRGVHPYILLNFDGTFSSVSVLAHELGHTMNQWYSDESQPTVYHAGLSSIVTEVASTLNELLLSDYMIKNAQTDAQRRYYIAQQMSTIYTTFFVQARFARFQQISMEALERGETLTADRLDQLWTDNERLFSGEMIKNVPGNGIGWVRIPHFYAGYYVYQYAVAISASCDIAQRIAAGDEAATERYLAYIAAGDPGSVADTLLIAGVDASDGSMIDGLVSRFETLIAEYEGT